jgi:hypothetical protein
MLSTSQSNIRRGSASCNLDNFSTSAPSPLRFLLASLPWAVDDSLTSSSGSSIHRHPASPDAPYSLTFPVLCLPHIRLERHHSAVTQDMLVKAPHSASSVRKLSMQNIPCSLCPCASKPLSVWVDAQSHTTATVNSAIIGVSDNSYRASRALQVSFPVT